MNKKRNLRLILGILFLLFFLPVWGDDQLNTGLQIPDPPQSGLSGILVSGSIGVDILTGESSGSTISGIINTQSGSNDSGNNSGNTSGSTSPSVTGNIYENSASSYNNNLIISEVYYDGSDEWLEISNIGTNYFSGIINISGSINLSIRLDIQKNQSVLIVKPSGNYGHILSNIVRFPSLSSFGLTDTKQITLNLIINGVQTDSFFVDTGLVNQYNDKKTSFQKNQVNGNYIISATSGYQTTISGYLISPGTISIIENIDTSGQTGQNQQNGTQNTGLIQISTEISIQEFCLQFFTGFQGKIIFSGISQGNRFSLEITGDNPVIISGFCSDNGWLSTGSSGQSGRVLDNALSSSGSTGLTTTGTSSISNTNTSNLNQNTQNYPNYPGEVKIQNLNPFGDEYVILKSYATFPVDLNSHDWFLLNKTTKRYLSGILYSNSSITVYKRFGFPDDGACIDLYYKETKMDTRCYTKPVVEKELTEPKTKTQTGEQNLSGYENLTGLSDLPIINIISIMPDVIGKDDQEMITLLVETGTTETIVSLKSYYLQVNKRKIYLTGTIYPKIPLTLTGKFAFPNKASCVELYGNKILQNKFCYNQPKAGQIFGTGNQILKDISLENLNILQDVKLITTGDQICSSYKDQILVCRNMPSSKTSVRLKNENKLYSQYASLIESYLKKNRSVLYFNTEIQDYFDVFKSAKKVVKKFGSTVNISGNIVDVYDLSGQIALTTNTGYLISTSSNILFNSQNNSQKDGENSGKNLPQVILLIQKFWGRTSVFRNS